MKPLLPALACALSVTAFPTHAREGESPPPQHKEIETLVVTAHRVPVESRNVDSALSIVDRNLLTHRQQVFAANVLQDLPGVAVSRASGYGSQTQVRIRGAEANHVLVLIDGVEANDPAGNDEFDFTSLTSYDIQEMEVLRGPQSALWGSDATAGVISITTRRGSAPVGGSVFVESGSENTLFTGGRLSLNTERGGMDLNASYFDTDGKSAAAAGDEDDGYENLNLSLHADWAPDDVSEFSFITRYTDGTTEYDGVDFATGLPADADLKSEDSLLLVGVKAGLSLFADRWEQTFRITYLDSDRDQHDAGRKTSTAAAEKTGLYYQSALRPFEDGALQNSRLILGLDYEEEEFTQRGAASPFGDPNQNQEIDNTGYVAEFLAEPLTGLSISASVRYDDNSDFDNVTTYRFTTGYLLPGTRTRFRGSYGTGQKSPTFIERFGFFADQFVGNPDLKPEKNAGFDVGVSQGLFQGRTRVDLTWFSERLEDEIDGFVFDPEAFVLTAANLDGTSKRDGVEFAMSNRLSANLDVTLSYTYTNSREPDSAGGNSREIRRPRHMAAANLNHRMFNGRGNLNVNVSYTGEQDDRYFPPPVFAPETVELDSYVVVDVAASYSLTPRIALYGRIDNLFDEDYANVFGFRSPARGAHAGVRMQLAR